MSWAAVVSLYLSPSVLYVHAWQQQQQEQVNLGQEQTWFIPPRCRGSPTCSCPGRPQLKIQSSPDSVNQDSKLQEIHPTCLPC